MKTLFFVGYGLFAVVVLIAINGWLRRRAQASRSPHQGALDRPPVHVRKIVAVFMIGAFVAILNQTLINVALPHMMDDFHVSASTIQWLSTGFLLVNGMLIPLSAYLIERFGTRRLFLFAMGSFLAGTVLCAVAPNFLVLLTGRLVQAVGAGIVMPLMMTVFLSLFPPERRGRAMGTMGIPMMFAPAIGPTLSGWIVEEYHWRLLFWILLPLLVIDIVLALRWMRDITQRRQPQLDRWGVLFSTVGFGALLYGFSEAGNRGWDDSRVLLFLAIGVLGLIALVWREMTTAHPLLDFRVFRYGMFSLTMAISAVLNMALFAAMILLPIYLQTIRGFTPMEAGLLLLPGALVMGIMSPIAGALFDRIGARWLAIIGLALTLGTTWAFAHLTPSTSYRHLLLLYTLRMFGMSFLMMTIMTAGLNALPRSLHAHGTAMTNTLRQVSASLGTALLVTVMADQTKAHLNETIANLSTHAAETQALLQETTKRLAETGGMAPTDAQVLLVQSTASTAAKHAMVAGINDAFVVATWLTALALVLAFFLRKTAPDRDDTGAPKPNPQPFS